MHESAAMSVSPNVTDSAEFKIIGHTYLKLCMRKAAFEWALEQGHNISECELSIIYVAC